VADAEDYVRRLRQVGATFDRVIEGLERRAAAGIVVPDGLLDGAIDNIWRMKEASGTNHPYNARLSEALEGADWIDRGTRSRLIGAASRAVRDVVTPAYERLYDAATGLRDATPTDHGVWQYPDGDGYYAYLLHHYTGTDLTAEEIHEIGLREVARLRDGIREASAFLGLTDDVPFSSIFGHTARSSGSLYGAAILEEYQRLIRYAQQGVVGVFGRLPETEVAVEGHEAGGYYVPAPRDGSSPGTFYAADRGQQAVYRMPNLTYHETVPGHHLQIALAQELDLPLLLSEETFLGFSEGWALYAERLAWELGWYDDDPHGNLGRLQDEMMRAVRLVVDTGLHIKGWPFYEAVDYFVENTGRARGEAQYNIMRYSAWPGQATAYMIGMLEILDQRERAKSALGEEFDLAAFHDAVLERGNIPLSMLDGIVSEFIEHQLSGS